MKRRTIRQIPITLITIAGLAMANLGHSNSDLSASIDADYKNRLGDMFKHFYANPELSTGEFKTAKKIAKELRAHCFNVTENVGGTGLVALLKNGAGPLVMMRADMDGLPVKEKTGLSYCINRNSA